MKLFFRLHPTISHQIPKNPTIISLFLYIYIIRYHNGVVAWNSKQAIIKTTAEYKKQEFNAVYATQSGPMLVYKGKINPQFLADSTSFKIRNGVGIKDNQLYFVISQQAVNFYQFAQFFKQQLKIDNALYLDGSISSLYVADTRRNDQNFNLGPIVAEVAKTNCRD